MPYVRIHREVTNVHVKVDTVKMELHVMKSTNAQRDFITVMRMPDVSTIPWAALAVYVWRATSRMALRVKVRHQLTTNTCVYAHQFTDLENQIFDWARVVDLNNQTFD